MNRICVAKKKKKKRETNSVIVSTVCDTINDERVKIYSKMFKNARIAVYLWENC